MKQVLVEVVPVVLYWLMIEENSMEKNSDERERMLDYYYLKQQQQLKNKQIDQVTAEIVEKMHDEENQHQVLIMLMLVM